MVEGPDAGRALARVTAFSDGVFAIAITLLVLTIDVPNLTRSEQHRLGQVLLDQWHVYFAFFLSFVVIARFWLVHHRLFLRVTRLDDRAMVLNFAYLASVVLIPFSTNVLGNYPKQRPAVLMYALVVGATTLFAWLLVHHALTAGLLRESDRLETRRQADRVALLRPGLFMASVPVAFVSTAAAEVLWVVSLLVRRRLPLRRTR